MSDRRAAKEVIALGLVCHCKDFGFASMGEGSPQEGPKQRSTTLWSNCYRTEETQGARAEAGGEAGHLDQEGTRKDGANSLRRSTGIVDGWDVV